MKVLSTVPRVVVLAFLLAAPAAESKDLPKKAPVLASRVEGYRSYHPDFALPTRVSCVLEGEATRRFEPSTVVAWDCGIRVDPRL